MVNNHLKSDTIKHGFQTCGLYPWSPDAIDYSKCLGKARNITTNVSYNISDVKDDNFITFGQFKNILGIEKIKWLANSPITADLSEDDINFKKMIDLFVKNSPEKATHGKEVATLRNKETDKKSVDKTECTTEENETKNKNEIYEAEEQGQVIENYTATEDIDLTSHNSNMYHTFKLEDIPIILEKDMIHLKSDTTDTIEIIEYNIAEDGVSGENGEMVKKDDPDSTAPVFDEEACLENYIFYPKTPERKGKKNTEKLSFVLTSSSRQRDHLKKIKKKKEEEEAKEKRKAQRLEAKKKRDEEAEIKKKKRENGNITKKRQKQNSTKTIVSEVLVENENIVLEVREKTVANNSKETENQNLKECDKQAQQVHKENNNENSALRETNCDEEELRPKIIVPVETKRNLFCNKENEQKPKINILSDIVVSNPFKNVTVTTGLCYTCVSNLNSSLSGVRCAYCIRTYHIKCIMKHSELYKTTLEDKLFRCPSCSKKNI